MATHAHGYSGLDLPAPWRAAAPLCALAIAAAAFEAYPRLPWLIGAAGGVCFAVAAVVRAVQARLELAAVRRSADRLICHEPRSLEASELVRWRTAELTSTRARTALRREVARTIAALDPRLLPSASPLNRPAARASEHLLWRIADRLDDSTPVSARGVLLVRSLLRDASSPLYAEDAAVILPRALTRVIGALEP